MVDGSGSAFHSEGMRLTNVVEYGYYSTCLYTEYGFSRKLTGIISFPFLNYTYYIQAASLNRQSIWKTGDADIGFKYVLNIDQPIVISTTFVLGLLFGYHKENDPLQTGDGEFNQALRINAASYIKLFGSNAWWNVYTGYNHRSMGYADEIQYGLKAISMFLKTRQL